MELFKRREYKKVELYEGKVFIGYQQYFEVRDIWKGEVTLLEMAGDAHRVERGPRAAIERLLQMVVDGYQSMEDAMRYMEEEYLTREYEWWQYGLTTRTITSSYRNTTLTIVPASTT